MSLIITLLTGVLVLNCMFLILMVLIQLPKKEAGLGQAFGSGATDALFGAGSGTVLTKATKYTAGSFLGMCLLLSVLSGHSNEARKRTRALEEGLSQRPAAQQLLPTQAPVKAPVASNNLLRATTTASNMLLSAPAPTPATTTGTNK